MAFPACDQDDRDLDILATKCFVGTARVDISCLKFLEGRQIDNRIVQDLVRGFQQVRCRRYDPDNFIPVLITESNFQRALRVSDINQTALKNSSQDGSFYFLKTAKNQKLVCAHGRHRIKAAEQFLDPNDRWWPVKLFVVDSHGTHVNSIFDRANSWQTSGRDSQLGGGATFITNHHMVMGKSIAGFRLARR
jgi:hypothetical protein